MSDFGAELADLVRGRVRDVPDFPKPDILFKDLTPVWGHGPTLKAINEGLADRYRGQKIDAFVGIESRGFINATPLAIALGTGVVLLRKPGKLPWKTVSAEYALEYGTDSLHMHEDAITAGMRVVIVDDLLATGGTMGAAIELVKKQGGEVVEAAFLVELSFLGGREKLSAPSAAVVTY